MGDDTTRMTQWRITLTLPRLARHAEKRHADVIHACGTSTKSAEKTCGEHPDDVTIATFMRPTHVN
jgi:hypothetical protein